MELDINTEETTRSGSPITIQAVFEKSPEKWTSKDLSALNFVFKDQDEHTFFGDPLPPYHGPPGFLLYEQTPNVEHERLRFLDNKSYNLIDSLEQAPGIHRLWSNRRDHQNSFVRASSLFTGLLNEWYLIPGRGSYPWPILLVCHEGPHPGNMNRYNDSPVDLQGDNPDSGADHDADLNPSVPWAHWHPEAEAQLVVEAIAAYQHNIQHSGNQGVEVSVVPGFTLHGTFPIFYKIPVTAELDQCIQQGIEPKTQTIVHRFTPCVPFAERKDEGMGALPNREYLMRCFQAFEQFVLPFHFKGFSGKPSLEKSML